MLRRNVLIFHQAALGDFVLTWPIALAVARILPQSRVIYVSAADKGKLAEAVLRVESTDAEAGWHTLLQPKITLEQLPAHVARFVSAAHTAIIFRAASSPGFAETLKGLQPDLRVIDLITTPEPGRLLVGTFIAQTAGWQPLQAASEQILAGIRQRGIAIARQSGMDVLIHPGSGGHAKRWPLSNFIDVAKALSASGKSVQFVIGEVEVEQFSPDDLNALASAAPVLPLQRATDLLQLIARAAVFLGNDSGPTHLAAIVGTPSVALFGPTDPAIWSPIGPRVNILNGDPIGSIVVDAVRDAVLACF